MSAGVDRSRPPRSGSPRPIPTLPFEREALGSGLTLALAPRHEQPLVDLELVLPAGGERNPADRPGLARLTASLLDEGTGRRTGRALSAELERRGCALGTSSDWNAASIHMSLPSGEIEFALELTAELLLAPAFPERELDRLRRQGLAELARRVDDPAALAEEAFARELYAGTVYAELLLGSVQSLAAMSRDEIADFHAESYRLAGAQLVIAGDLPEGRIAALVERALAAAPRREPLLPVLIESPPLPGLRILVVDRPGAAQTELRVGQVGIPRRHPDRAALGFLSSLFGGKFTSRINLNLREQRGITYGAHSRIADRRSAGPFSVASAVSNASVGLAASEVLRELGRMREEKVGREEIEETRSYLLGVFPYGLQTIQGLAARLRDIALYDLPLDHTARVIAEYERLTDGDLLRIANEHLHPDRCLVVAAGPAAEIVPQLEALGEPRLVQPDSAVAAGLIRALPAG
jgi:zinc protease